MTTIIKATGVTIPGLPKLYRDKIITAGSKYLFDFEDAYCNPHTRGVNLSANATMRDLVSGNPLGVVFGANVLNGAAGKGVKLPGINDNGIDFGTSFDTGQSAVLIILWVTTRTGDTPAANSFVFGRASTIGSGQYITTGGGDGKTLGGTFGLNGTLASGVQTGGALTANVPMQIAYFWNGDSRTGWTNGVGEVTFTNVAATMNSGTTWTEGIGRKTTAGATAVLGFNTGWQGSIFRVYKEDVGVVSADATTRLNWARAQVVADYQNNVSRFS